jgi:uncharacterized protein
VTDQPAGRDPERERPIPSQEGEPLRKLDPRAVTLWRLNALIHGAFLVPLVLAGEWMVRPPVPLGVAAATVAILAIAGAALLPPIRYRSWSFALRESDLYLRQGILFRTTSIVPLTRIQHVDTRHGPVDRALGLADLIVYTAGTRGAVVTVPALDMATAEALRDQLVDLSGAGDAV